MDPVVAGAVVLSALCIGHLWWKRRAPTAKKILWTFILCVPAVGPLFYGATLDRLPEENDDPPDESDTDAEDV